MRACFMFSNICPQMEAPLHSAADTCWARNPFPYSSVKNEYDNDDICLFLLVDVSFSVEPELDYLVINK